jgi:phosphoglycolate phosphatase-like HAD superfamily hydrolase
MIACCAVSNASLMVRLALRWLLMISIRQGWRRPAEPKSVPPGYEDSDKTDPHGDYLVWTQLLAEAKARRLPVLFVTRDVKEDWFWREKGRTLGARPELVEEARRVAGVRLIIVETTSFLHQAKRHLAARVSDETLRQAELLPPFQLQGLPEEQLVISLMSLRRIDAAAAARAGGADSAMRNAMHTVQELRQKLLEAELDRAPIEEVYDLQNRLADAEGDLRRATNESTRWRHVSDLLARPHPGRGREVVIRWSGAPDPRDVRELLAATDAVEALPGISDDV